MDPSHDRVAGREGEDQYSTFWRERGGCCCDESCRVGMVRQHPCHDDEVVLAPAAQGVDRVAGHEPGATVRVVGCCALQHSRRRVDADVVVDVDAGGGEPLQVAACAATDVENA